MTPLERAVEALKAELGGSPFGDGQWLIDGPFPESDITSAVRAVLAAIREPSQWMTLAGAGRQPFDDQDDNIETADLTWKDMIDELLTEEAEATRAGGESSRAGPGPSA